ncbi:Ig-like domain repeat protein [Nocardioides daejeonensis]|uniref:Ig-like domain repeat protein n=1 Tax=Nocardioides daejeonensis TaxID=1046556 RepID=UPI000D74DECF|nr:Ig-like domain repeat protein [Nocardioides daejeonensis]
MSARRYAAGLATAAVVVASFAAAPAASADPTFVPQSTDLVGVGSDTSQFALGYLADGHTVNGVAVPGYNAGKSTNRLVSFDATGGGNVTLVQGATPITRPNGSGAGKGRLYGTANDADVDYARSSSALNSAEKEAGLQAFPFAVDVLEMAIAKGSNAPASVSEADLLKIYTGQVTNWSQIGGKSGVIVPMIPQSGSGTRSFFEGELKRINGGNAPTLAGSVVEVQEHDDTPIKANPHAIAPFSAGRAKLDGTLNLVAGGLSAKRALYNVVRQADVAKADILGVFGSDGFICSDAARPLIEAAGFDQMARPTNGGVCGEATQGASSNFATNVAQATQTALTATSPAGGTVALSATVSAGGNAPDGKVQFLEGETVVGEASIAQGTAKKTLTGVAAGAHNYTARFLPTGVAYQGSVSAPVAVTVKAAAQVAAVVAPVSTSYGKAAKVTVTVTGAAGEVTGQVTATAGGKKVTGSLASGTATLTLPADVAVGTQTVAVAYAGNATYGTGTATAELAVSKGITSLKSAFAKKIKKNKKASGKVTVTIPGSALKASGKVTVKEGKKVLGTGTLKAGVAKVTLKSLKKGKHKLTVSFAGNGNLKAASATVTVTQK